MLKKYTEQVILTKRGRIKTMEYARTESRDDERYVVFRMKDNSMAPDVKEGDEIQVDTRAEVKDGDLVVALIEDGRTILRKMKQQKDGEYIFTPINARQYEPIFSNRPLFIGRAVRLYRKFTYEPFKKDQESNIKGFVTLPELDSEREGTENG